MALSTRLSIAGASRDFVAADDRGAGARPGEGELGTSRSPPAPPRGRASSRSARRGRPARSARATIRRRAARPRRCRRSAGRAGTTSWRTTSSSCRRSAGSSTRSRRVDRGAQRGERVLELVGDVGGEGLGGVDPVPQRLAHVAERAGEQADLVAPRRAGAAPRPRGPAPAARGGRHERAGAAAGRWSGRGTARAGSRRSGSRARISSSDRPLRPHRVADVARVDRSAAAPRSGRRRSGAAAAMKGVPSGARRSIVGGPAVAQRAPPPRARRQACRPRPERRAAAARAPTIASKPLSSQRANPRVPGLARRIAQRIGRRRAASSCRATSRAVAAVDAQPGLRILRRAGPGSAGARSSGTTESMCGDHLGLGRARSIRAWVRLARKLSR